MKKSLEELRYKQSLPLAQKIEMSQCVIEQWWGHWDGKVYVGFSGGKDSTVLLHLVRSIFPAVLGVFSDTGLEFPEVKEFVKETENIKVIRPKLSYRQVIEKYGYPVVSKEVSLKISKVRKNPTNAIANYYMTGHKKDGTYNKRGKIPEKWKYLIDAPFNISWMCCDALKKKPFKLFHKETGLYPYIGYMAGESQIRSGLYQRFGCNAFDNKSNPYSAPLSFWLEDDVWEYIKMNNIKYSKIYDLGQERTGCMWCMFGIHMEKGQNRFQLMKSTHPKIYNYAINDLGLGDVLDYLEVEYE